jgi:hypothetical protein
LRVALGDGLLLARVEGGEDAERIAADVQDYLSAQRLWVESDWTGEAPEMPAWARDY